MLPSWPQLKYFAPGPYSFHSSRNIARKLEFCPLRSYLCWVPKVNSQHILHARQQGAIRTRTPLQKGSCSVFQYLHKQQQQLNSSSGSLRIVSKTSPTEEGPHQDKKNNWKSPVFKLPVCTRQQPGNYLVPCKGCSKVQICNDSSS